jgi:hypothetical protein
MGHLVGVGVLLDQPGRQVAPQLTGAGLTLIEGDKVDLMIGVEHQVERSGGVSQPAAA